MGWIPIKYFELLYEFNSMGQVRSLDRVGVPNNRYSPFRKGKILKHSIRNGYPMVTLQENKRKKRILIHRLIAEYFIPNPINKPFVNHKNGDRSDFRIENLEWCTASENVIHSFRELGHKTSFVTDNGYKNYREKRVHCSNFDIVFNSAADAERQLGIKNIPQICNGVRSQRNGIHLRYLA